MTYALIPIGLSALLAYGITLILSRVGLISRSLHRQLWNTLLLLTFLTTAILGIILAIQVNYKLEMPVVEQLIVWHVDFGIGMSFIAIFHFSWHWSYYWKIITGKRIPLPGKEEPAPGNRALSYREIPASDKLPLAALGATAMITQVVLLREYLAIFHGNELVIGVILAGWLLLTGTGALIGKNISEHHMKSNFTSLAFLLLGILPLLTVVGTRIFKNFIFPLGSMTGIPGILIYSIAGMSIFCILSGFLFTWLSTRISMKHKSNLLNFSYATESAGSIFAGILFSFLLVYLLNTFQILFIILLMNLYIAIAGSLPGRKIKMLIWSGLITLVFAVAIFGFDLDLITRSSLFRNQELLESRDTPYGNLVISKTGEQYNLYENSSPISFSDDIASVEEDVHYAMVQHPDPGNILVLSGNLSAVAVELDKYPVKNVDFIELNPWITRMRASYVPYPEAPWLRVLHMDGRRFLGHTEHRYDVVLVNLPPPGSAQLNRFYTAEFFAELKSNMAQGAVLSIPLQGMENYISEEAGELYSILYHTLRLSFKNILVVPGYKTYFLASDTALDIDIPALIDSRKIETVYVNSFYLDPQILHARSSQVLSLIPETAEINRDFHPRAFFHQIRYWLSYFNSNLWITLGIFILLIFLAGFRRGAVEMGIFITGFTGMGIEIVLLLAIQAVFGFIYQYTAVILTVFMMGLAGGALYSRRILPNPSPLKFAMLQILLACCVFIVLWWLRLLDAYSIPSAVMHSVFVTLTFSVAFLTGLLFATAALIRKSSIQNTAGSLYSADLSGSAAGALIMAILMVPLLGLSTSLLVLLLINLIGFLNSILRRSFIGAV
ncbi:fused MFS/spermidine synthase [Bacteroidota bacterium]